MMAVKIGVYFDREDADRVIDSLQSLPNTLRPIFFSEEESLKSRSDRLANEQRFRIFRDRNPAGFFLFSESCSYNFFINRRGYSVMFVYLEDRRMYTKVPILFRAVAAADPIFGHAGDPEEYDHRNRYYITIGMNQIEDWIGRDLEKYIPGVYWYTLLSNKLLNKHGVDLSRLSSEAISTETIRSGDLHLLKFYENPEEWKENAERLDKLCERTDGVFSRKSVETAVSGVSNYLEYEDIIADWR